MTSMLLRGLLRYNDKLVKSLFLNTYKEDFCHLDVRRDPSQFVYKAL